MKIQREEELYQPVKDFLEEQGFMVRGEVHHCDLVAMKNDDLVIVELKRHLSVELLVQGVQRQKLTDYVYLAIPKPRGFKHNKKWTDVIHLLRRLELGLLLVSTKTNKAMVEIAVQPGPFDRGKSKIRNGKRLVALRQEVNGRHQDLNTGGSQGKKLVTAYRENAIQIACYLEKYGPLSPKRLRELGTDAKKTSVILQDNYYGWFHRVSRGVYELSPLGSSALTQYVSLSDYYRQQLQECEAVAVSKCK